MELIEKPQMRAVHFLNSISYDDFKKDCLKEAEDNGDKNPTEKDIKTWFSILQQFCKTNIKTKGTTKRIYSYSLNTEKSELGGRLFCGNSMQGIWNVYRGLLMRDKGTDIDMANAHPVILRYICRLHSINCSQLEYYINNREECLNSFRTKNISRAQAKTMYLVATNNDKFMRNGAIKTEHFKKYEKEMKEIQKKLIELEEYKGLFETIEDYKKAKNYNGCAINKILCFYENKILQHAIHVINKRGIEIAILMFDGVMVYGDFYDDEELLKNITDYVEEMMPELKMTWAYKEHDNTLQIPEDFDETNYEKDKNFRFANDDNEASILILEEIKNTLIPDKNGRLFMKVGNIWICDNLKIENYLLDYILKSNICKSNEEKKYVPYVQNVKNAKNVREALLVKIRGQKDVVDIYNKFHTTTKGRLCFRDGVLDMRKRTFYKWDAVDFEYFTTIDINYDYADYFNNPNREVINEIKQQIFINLFGNSTQTALKFLSRAVAGHMEDKNWATYLGKRDCGKGVLFEILKGALQDYVRTFELGNILIERSSQMEEISRKLYWLIDYEFVRLAISQETDKNDNDDTKNRSLKVSGKMLKKLAGGGDEQVARRNYDRTDTIFKLQTTFMMMGNDEIKVDIKDTNEHRIEFTGVNQYKTQEQIDRMRENGDSEILLKSYKVKDPAIKERCNTEEWKKALVFILFENYSDTAVEIYLDEVEDDVGETLRSKILHKFEITGNTDDMILATTVNGILCDNPKKITAELLSMGITKKKYKGRDNNFRDKLCFFGLKYIEIDEPENTANNEIEEF